MPFCRTNLKILTTIELVSSEYFYMTNKVIEFLFQIGFSGQDIDEFCQLKPDTILPDGREFYGNDILYAIVQEDELYIDLRDTNELIEAYWEKAWHSGYCIFHRANFDSYKGRCYKTFPTRYKLWEFRFTKNLRRVLKKNSDLKTVIRPLRITPAKSDLFDAYHYLWHGEPPRESLAKSYEYIKYYPTKLMELCIFKEDKLIACSIFEVGNFSMYSNVGFWDLNEASRSLGTLTILLEVQYALKHNFAYYYLGQFYAQNPNYHYKARFSGLELWDWDKGYWIDFKFQPRIKELLKQKLPRHND